MALTLEEVRRQVFSSEEHKRFLKKQALDQHKRESAERISASTRNWIIPNTVDTVPTPPEPTQVEEEPRAVEELTGTISFSSY